MSTAPEYHPHYTVDDYRLWQGDWELWNGVAVAMTPSPFGRHARLLIDIGAALKTAIERSGCDATVLGEIDWIISQDTVVRPDLSVVCGPEPKRHVQHAPAIVVEILSEATRDRDLNHKRRLYEQQTVAVYLIVDAERSQLTVLQLGGSGTYEEMRTSDTLVFEICDQCTIRVDTTGWFQ